MTFFNNISTNSRVAVFAFAAAFSTEDCGARTGLDEFSVVNPPLPETQSTIVQNNCTPNIGPRCNPRVQEVIRLDISSIDPARTRLALLNRHSQFRNMPLTDGFFMHRNDDSTSMDRPTLNNVTSAVENGGMLMLGGTYYGNAFLLFYHVNVSNGLSYADFRDDHDFVTSLTDWRNRFSPGTELHPDIALMSYFAMHGETSGASFHYNASVPGNNCTHLDRVTAMAVIEGILYVVDGNKNAVAAFPGFPGYSTISSALGIHRTGDRTNLCP